MQPIRRFLAGFATGAAIVLIVTACAVDAVTPPPTVDGPDAPVSGDPGIVDPSNGGGGQPGDLVLPRPGQLDVHPVAMDLLSATVDGRRVVVTASWTSGVEPCYTLDTILVDKGDHAFTITLREGHGPGDMACIEIAMQKRTQVDLGELEPGTYPISDGQGGASPIEVTVT